MVLYKLAPKAPYLPSGTVLHTSRGRSPQPVREASAGPGQNPWRPGPKARRRHQPSRRSRVNLREYWKAPPGPGPDPDRTERRLNPQAPKGLVHKRRVNPRRHAGLFPRKKAVKKWESFLHSLFLFSLFYPRRATMVLAQFLSIMRSSLEMASIRERAASLMAL